MIFVFQFLEAMSEMVQKGIIEANEELQKEHTHRLMEEVSYSPSCK